MKKTVLRFGLLSGIFLGSIFFFLKPFMKEISFTEILGYLCMLIGLSAIFFGIRSLRKINGKSGITFKQAFLTGLYISIIASVFYAVGWVIFFHTIGDNGMMDGYFQSQIDQIENTTLDLEQAGEKIQGVIEYRDAYLNNPLFMFGLTLLEIFPIAFLITIISSLILRRKPEYSQQGL